MRAAQIKNGIVVNYAEVVAFGGEFVNPGNSVLGATWNGGIFTNPIATETETKNKNNAAVDAKILALEGTMTLRIIRESFLTGDKAFFQDVDSQIVALRAQKQ